MRWKRPLSFGLVLGALGLALLGYFVKNELYYDPTVWRQDFPSPDGAWVATATTRQWGGFGSAWVETTVSLKSTGTKFVVDKNQPFDVFSYPDGMIGKAYSLDPVNSDTELTVRWTSPEQLNIGHRSSVNPDLIVIRRANVNIKYDPGSFADPNQP